MFGLTWGVRSIHCVKSVRIQSSSGPYFPAFGLNTEGHSVSLRIQFECGKIRTRTTPNTDTFYTVIIIKGSLSFNFYPWFARLLWTLYPLCISFVGSCDLYKNPLKAAQEVFAELRDQSYIDYSHALRYMDPNGWAVKSLWR